MIGDSSICAGNLPSLDPNHVYKIVKAALEIQAFIVKYNLRRVDKSLQPWEISIGLHVVAGVVGKKEICLLIMHIKNFGNTAR